MTPMNVVFDLGGVLIDWNPRYVFRELFAGDDAAMETFLRDVCSPTWNEKQDEGRLWNDAVNELVVQFPSQAAMIRAFRDRWPDMLKGEIPGTVEILLRLREQGVQLYSITNWSAETFGVARERFPFLAWFKDIVVSGVEKTLKPRPEIYQILLERNRLAAASCVFIDDVAGNVQGARQVGFKSIQFTSPAGLEAELRVLDLLD